MRKREEEMEGGGLDGQKRRAHLVTWTNFKPTWEPGLIHNDTAYEKFLVHPKLWNIFAAIKLFIPMIRE